MPTKQKPQPSHWQTKALRRRGPLAALTVTLFALILALAGCQTATPQPSTATPPPTPTTTATPSPTNTPTSEPATSPTADRLDETPPLSPEERASLEAIAQEVSGLRELDADRPLSLAFMTPDELHAWLIEQLAEEYPPQEAYRDTQVYAALELLPPDTDLYALMLTLYTEQIAGFYDNDTDQMTVIDDQVGLDALDKMVFAHEYTHDLQDQRLNLDDLQTYRESADNEDTARAITALVEGDAQTISLLYLFHHVDELDLSALETIQTAELDAAPPVIREELAFPYMAGLAFVQVLLQEGGWETVNAAYTALPQSTEHILHPQKYLAGEAPIAVSLPPLTSTLGADWQMVRENTLGEFLLNLYLDVHLSAETAQQASAGWGGDRFALYKHATSSVSLLVIVTAWDSDDEAAQFSVAYQTFAGDKYGQPAAAQDALGAWWQGENDVTLLTRVDGRVVVVIGPDTATLQNVRLALEGLGAGR